jgi:uroporphyrinogen decarboxylase
MGGMNKRQRLEAAITGTVSDRPPVALWRHWPGDDRTAEGLAASTLRFQREFDFDFVKVTPASSFCVQDWGARDEWRGNTEGTRDYTFYPVKEPGDWEQLPMLDPGQGSLGDQLRCLRLIGAELGEEIPFIQTIFSPLTQAKNLVGGDSLLVHLRRDPAALHTGLQAITETTIQFIESARGEGIAGVFYAVQHAQYGVMSEDEYNTFGRPYDLSVLKATEGMWLNVLHLHGKDVMFKLLADYPAQVVNWHDRESGPSLSEGLTQFAGAVCGGLARNNTVVQGTSEQVKAEADDAREQTGGQRFVLGTGCVVPIIAPWGNVLTARQVVEEWREE